MQVCQWLACRSRRKGQKAWIILAGTALSLNLGNKAIYAYNSISLPWIVASFLFVEPYIMGVEVMITND
jgi:hypothetical protein